MKRPMPISVARSGFATAVLGHLAFFAGGTSATGPNDVVDIYNARTGRWSRAKLSRPRSGLTAVAVGHRVLFAGGELATSGGQDNRYTDLVDVYDTRTHRWSTAHLSRAQVDARAVAVGKLAIFAGGRGKFDDSEPNGATDVVDVYDAATDRWSTATLAQPRAISALVAAGSRVFFAGGMRADGSASDVVDVFDTASGEWSVTRLSPPGYSVLGASAGGAVVFLHTLYSKPFEPGLADVYTAESNPA